VRACTKCGADNRPGARFCDACGAPLAARLESDSGTPTETIAGGRYELLRLLGEGGKKRVYLAHDGQLDREVAVALIKGDALDAAGRARVLREAQAMGRLGAHPHVVTVFDLGEEDGRPYLVTELMAGGDLEGVVAEAPQGHVPLQQVLELAKGICRGLAFAHEQGLVHRDLKPGNVWLTEDGRPKIGDFGLALRLGASRLTQTGTIVGTASYLPPEQALGAEVTPQSDLYSLGALLYELVTGRPPFLGDDPVAVISQHINTPPVAPRWHTPECPRALEALVLRLLAKDPAERPQSAADVLAALEAIDPAAAADPADGREGDSAALDSLAGGVFVGRQHELGQLKAALEGPLSGEGRMVMLVGEPGIGKTRTALELSTYARLRGARVLWGRCYESEGAPPYWPWVQAVRSYVRDVEPEQLHSELGAGAAEIAEIIPDVRQRLPGLPAAVPVEDPKQARFRLFDALTAFLKSAARGQPLVLVLDDLHWADDGSLSVLEFVARELADARLFLIGTYRDVDLSRRHPLSHSLAELTRERLFERVLLRGLSREDVGRFVEATSGIPPPAELIDAVYAHTEGNPLFVTEVVRLLAQEGELSHDRFEDRDGWSVRIPEGVREVIGRRLERLSDRCNETLALASVIGREFGLDQLDRLIDDLSADRLLEVLEEALAARVIEELPRAVSRYQFTHALIQETLAHELSLTRTVRLHARIAQTLEDLYGAEADQHASELAHHFGEAESLLGPEKSVRYSLLSGEAALAAHAGDQARTHFERALTAKEGLPMDDETAALLFGLGRAMLSAIARYELKPAVSCFRRAFEHYLEAGDVSRAVAVAAHPIPLNLGLGYTDFPGLISRALELVAPGSHEVGRLLAQHGWFAGIANGDFEAADSALREALSIAQRFGDTALERGALANLAWVDVWHFRYEEGVELGLRSIELSDSSGDQHTMNAHRSVAWALTALGRSQEVRGHAGRELEIAEAFRDRWLLASAGYDSARQSLYEGDWDGVLEMSEICAAAQPRDPRGIAMRALLHYELGDFAEGAAGLDLLEDVADGVAPPGPIAEHAFLAGVLPLAARIEGTDTRLDLAEKVAAGLLSLPRLVPALARVATRSLALVALQRGETAEVARLYTEVEADRGKASMFVPLVVDRLLGLLAAATGRVEAAEEHFDEALALCERAGFRPERAWTACDYAETLLAAGGDHSRIVALQDEALAIGRELGMGPLIERTLGGRDLLKA
jgi:tetratricopeptide (TPR) repeat protein